MLRHPTWFSAHCWGLPAARDSIWASCSVLSIVSSNPRWVRKWRHGNSGSFDVRKCTSAFHIDTNRRFSCRVSNRFHQLPNLFILRLQWKYFHYWWDFRARHTSFLRKRIWHKIYHAWRIAPSSTHPCVTLWFWVAPYSTSKLDRPSRPWRR